ncbi:MAG: hypothetical protein ACK56I_23785, partial [bacterium]
PRGNRGGPGRRATAAAHRPGSPVAVPGPGCGPPQADRPRTISGAGTHDVRLATPVRQPAGARSSAHVD